MNDTELELAQLLCTRLCHDLAGPVGAVAAGVELIGGDPTQVDTETLGLIGNSSDAASLKLKFLRVVLGASGASSGDPRALLDGYLGATAGPGGKPAIRWPDHDSIAAVTTAVGPTWCQVLLNLCLLALEAQAGCKSLAVQVKNGAGLTVVAETQGAPDRTAMVREDLAAAVAGNIPPLLTAKTIHGNFAGRLVRAAGGHIQLAASASSITVTARFPAAAS
jgi:histidine phosphotransferase ChpT